MTTRFQLCLAGLGALGALGAIGACDGSTIVVGGLQEVAALKAKPNRNLDLLFVVDNSPSMSDKQLSLVENFPRMMQVLESLDGGLPNLHIGVVSSDMGTTGSSMPDMPGPPIGQPGIGGCAGVGDDGLLQIGTAPVGGRFLSDIAAPDGTRIRNYDGALASVFQQMATLGVRGCGFEQHLASMRRALEQPANAGFLRDDANLAVVILADEDDCSVLDPQFFGDDPALGLLESFRCTRHGVRCDPDNDDPGPKTNCEPREDSALVEGVEPFVDALVAAKGDPRKVMVAAIAGNAEPVEFELRSPPGAGTPLPALVHSCAYNGRMGLEVADPAVRLASFVDSFPGRSTWTTVCQSDLSGPLVEIGATAKKLVGDPCLYSPRLTDASPDPGLQPACEVIDVRDADPGSPREVPGCGPGGKDCFEIISDAVACPLAPENLRVRIHRSTPVSDDTWTHVRCQLEPAR